VTCPQIAAIFVAGGLICAAGFAVAQQPPSSAVTGEQITQEDLKNAKVVREFTPEEFQATMDGITAKECKKGTLHATSDGQNIVLDAVSVSIDEFGKELLRRYREKRFYCVEVVGPGGDVKRTSRLMRELKGTEITSINWRPQDNNEHH
jgi:hypothetical protein